MSGRDVADTLHRLHLAYVEPLIIAARKRGRLAAFGIKTPGDIAYGDLVLTVNSSDCSSACADLVAAERSYLAKYFECGRTSLVIPWWRGVASIIDLNRYPDFTSYAARVRLHSKG